MPNSSVEMKLNRIHYFRVLFCRISVLSCFSKNFPVTHNNQTRSWHFYYYHRDGLAKLDLYSEDDSVDFNLIFRISLVDLNGKNLTYPETFNVRGNSEKGQPVLKFATKLSDIQKFCDSLNHYLNFKIVIFSMDSNEAFDCSEPKDQGLGSSLLEDYKQMFITGQNSDLSVRASDGKELKLHKFPLITRSSAFNRMFNSDMKEHESGVLEIKDFDSIVLTELFRFIYYNHVENLENIDIELYKAAEKYLMTELKEKCLHSIFKTIVEKDIFKILEFADFYELKTLFEYGASIFMTNFKDNIESENWEKLQTELRFKVYDFIVQLNLGKWESDI